MEYCHSVSVLHADVDKSEKPCSVSVSAIRNTLLMNKPQFLLFTTMALTLVQTSPSEHKVLSSGKHVLDYLDTYTASLHALPFPTSFCRRVLSVGSALCVHYCLVSACPSLRRSLCCLSERTSSRAASALWRRIF